MLNKDKFLEIFKKHEKDIDSHDYRYFVPEVLHKCGAIALKEAEEFLAAFEDNTAICSLQSVVLVKLIMMQ